MDGRDNAVSGSIDMTLIFTSKRIHVVTSNTLVSEQVGKDLCRIACPLLLDRGHKVDQLFVDLVPKFSSFGCPTIHNLALFWGFVEFACRNVGVGVEEFVEQGRVEIGVDVGFRDQDVVCGWLVALLVFLCVWKGCLYREWGVRGYAAGLALSG